MDIKQFTEEELEVELLSRYGNFSESSFDVKEEKRIFAEARAINGFKDYIQVLLNQEIMRHFSATEDSQRWYSKGAFGRLLMLKNKFRIKQEKETEKIDTKIGGRYA